MITQYFALVFATNDPVTIEVHDTGLVVEGPETVRSHFLNQCIAMTAESFQQLPQGVYHFNLANRRWFRIEFELTPLALV
jgi:hypothetical protein